jgi:DNA-binding NtrC family response regulator
MLERAVIYCKYGLIQMEDLGIYSSDGHSKYDQGHGLALAELEREAIIRALEITGGNKSRAARLLGISRATLYEKLREIKGERDHLLE